MKDIGPPPPIYTHTHTHTHTDMHPVLYPYTHTQTHTHRDTHTNTQKLYVHTHSQKLFITPQSTSKQLAAKFFRSPKQTKSEDIVITEQ